MIDSSQFPADTNLWAEVQPEGLSNHQHAELLVATRSRIGVLCGGPGTGKTYTVGSLVSWLIKTYGLNDISICAPTGKAAVRCTEAMAAYGCKLRARTLHSALGPCRTRSGWRFEHGPGSPMEESFYVVDEASMLDTTLAAQFFGALPPNAHVLLVGDTGQLLPVGHGAPLRDVIAAGVPVGRLAEVRRNSGGIVAACHAIASGEPFQVQDNLLGSQAELPHLLAELQAEHGYGGKDIQVVCAVNERSDRSRVRLNEQLQLLLNRQGMPVTGTKLRIGDKVVCTSNTEFMLADGGGKSYVANGEVGYITSYDAGKFRISLESPAREVIVAMAAICFWDLAYALSVHKSQGSEFPCVIVVVDESSAAKQVCDRSWIYTAISRAKSHCVLWGQESTARRFAGVNRVDERKTFLKELLR